MCVGFLALFRYLKIEMLEYHPKPHLEVGTATNRKAPATHATLKLQRTAVA